MKILHWSFVFIAIIIPVSIICRVTVNSRFAALKDEVRINNAIDTATKDAIDQIIAVSGFDFDAEFGNVINITPALAQESINTFFHTMAINYNLPYKISDTTLIDGHSSTSDIKNYFAPYVPAIVVIAYDGFYIYSQEYIENIGYEYKLSPKIPFTYDYGDYSVGFTLGEDIYFYYDKQCYQGKMYYNDLSSLQEAYNDNYRSLSTDVIASITDDIAIILYDLEQKNPSLSISNDLIPSNSTSNFLQDYQKNSSGDYIVGDFHKKRREVIVKTISDCLKEEINVDHNRFADLVGATYEFYLPEITDDDWINSINDISVMAFVQGIPIGTLEGNYYNNYALGGSQIVRRDYLYGNTIYSEYLDKAIPLYHQEGCPFISGDNYDTIFITEDDAILEGYLPCQKCH